MTEHSLTHVEIDGFRGLRNLVMEDLGLINVLVGRNNSGKTSLLEALSILAEPLNLHSWMSMVYRRDFGNLDETRVQSLRWCFPHAEDRQGPNEVFEGECVMRCRGAYPLRELKATYRDVIGEPSEKERERRIRLGRLTGERDLNEPWRGGEITHYVSHERLRNAQQTLFDEPSSGSPDPISLVVWEEMPNVAGRRFGGHPLSIENETLTPYSYQINRQQVRSHSQHVFTKDRGLVLDLVHQFDPDVLGVELASFRGARPAIYVDHRKLGAAPLSVFGDALRRAVLLASTLPTLRDGGLLLIDEVETGIHVDALERVFEWLVNAARTLNVQIVATTHSLEAIDALVGACEGDLADVAAFQLHQSDRGSEMKRFSGDLLARLRKERGLDVR